MRENKRKSLRLRVGSLRLLLVSVPRDFLENLLPQSVTRFISGTLYIQIRFIALRRRYNDPTVCEPNLVAGTIRYGTYFLRVILF